MYEFAIITSMTVLEDFITFDRSYLLQLKCKNPLVFVFSQKYLEIMISKGLLKTLGTLASLLYMSLTHILTYVLL